MTRKVRITWTNDGNQLPQPIDTGATLASQLVTIKQDNDVTDAIIEMIRDFPMGPGDVIIVTDA